MAEMDLIKFAMQFGEAGLFLWLFLRLDARLERQNEKHDQDIKQLHEQRIQDLKLLARMPTDLIADYTMPPKAA